MFISTDKMKYAGLGKHHSVSVLKFYNSVKSTSNPISASPKKTMRPSE